MRPFDRDNECDRDNKCDPSTEIKILPSLWYFGVNIISFSPVSNIRGFNFIYVQIETLRYPETVTYNLQSILSHVFFCIKWWIFTLVWFSLLEQTHLCTEITNHYMHLKRDKWEMDLVKIIMIFNSLIDVWFYPFWLTRHKASHTCNNKYLYQITKLIFLQIFKLTKHFS